MSWCKCPLVGMPWCECPFVGMQWMQMPPCVYIMTRVLWCRHNLFKNFLYSKRGFHNAWNQNILKTWFIIHEKSSSFWLKAPKKLVITIRKSLNGAFTWNLMIWLKRLISTIWLRGWHVQGLFMEKWILWKSSILKRFIFLVFEYSNLIGIKTHLW